MKTTIAGSLHGWIRNDRLWVFSNDRQQLLMAGVDEAILGNTDEEVLSSVRVLYPLPGSYAELAERLPLSMLGRADEEDLTLFPLPVVRADPDVVSELEELTSVEEHGGWQLAYLLEKSGPILLEHGTTDEQRKKKWSSHTKYALSSQELSEFLPRGVGLDRRELTPGDDEAPSAWSSKKEYERPRYTLLQANPIALAKSRSPKPFRKPRKPRPKATPTAFFISHLHSFINSLYDRVWRATDKWLKPIGSYNIGTASRSYVTLQELIELSDQLDGKYAYRCCCDYRNAYKDLMTPVMKNPPGAIRKAYHLCKELGCWLERETESAEAKQIAKGTFKTVNRKTAVRRPTSFASLSETYASTSSSKTDWLPKAMQPKPKPPKKEKAHGP